MARDLDHYKWKIDELKKENKRLLTQVFDNLRYIRRLEEIVKKEEESSES